MYLQIEITVSTVAWFVSTSCIAQYLDLVLLCVFIWCHSQCTTLLGSNRLSIMWNRQPRNFSVLSDPTDESTLPLHSSLCMPFSCCFVSTQKQDILCSCSHVVLSCLNLVAGSMSQCFIRMDGLCCSCCACLQLPDASYNPQQHISFLVVKMLPVKIPEPWIFSRWGCSSIYIDHLFNQDEITDFFLPMFSFKDFRRNRKLCCSIYCVTFLLGRFSGTSLVTHDKPCFLSYCMLTVFPPVWHNCPMLHCYHSQC